MFTKIYRVKTLLQNKLQRAFLFLGDKWYYYFCDTLAAKIPWLVWNTLEQSPDRPHLSIKKLSYQLNSINFNQFTKLLIVYSSFFQPADFHHKLINIMRINWYFVCALTKPKLSAKVIIYEVISKPFKAVKKT